MNDLQRAIRIFAAANIALFLLIATVGALAWHSNSNRIRDREHTRRQACERTYEGIREVFRPFLPPMSRRTPAEQTRIRTFNNTIDRLKDGCTHPHH